MSFSQRLVVSTFKSLTSLICRIDDTQLAKIPAAGPLILYTNHINILEIPIIYTRLQPRHVHGMLLAERWNIPLVGWILDQAETIPLHRGQADFAAIRRGLEALKRGEMLIIAPEGTRSHSGQLQPAHPGVVLLALHSGAALIPVAYHGAERYQDSLKRLRRTDFHIEVGKPFHLDPRGQKVTRQVREQMVAELMDQLALLLPPEQRGLYGDAAAKTEYLVFT